MFKSLIILLFSSVILLFCQNVNALNNNLNRADKNSQDLNQNQNSQGQIQLKEGNDKKYEFFLVKFDRLAVMDSPSSSANILGTLAKGDTVKSIGFTTTRDRYHLVAKLIKFQYKEKVGYVNSLYLKKIYQYSSVGEKPDVVSIYASIIFISGVMFLGLLAN